MKEMKKKAKVSRFFNILKPKSRGFSIY